MQCLIKQRIDCLGGGGGKHFGNGEWEKKQLPGERTIKKMHARIKVSREGVFLEMYMGMTGTCQRAEMKWMLLIVRDQEKLAKRKA